MLGHRATGFCLCSTAIVGATPMNWLDPSAFHYQPGT
jgi:hypothetical protein